MTSSHADNHDRDKMARWLEDLRGDPDSGFPVCAVFLVSEKDRAAHNIFRAFRDSFDLRNAGFQNLVIFGQHGVSATVNHLLDQFGLTGDALPSLALLTGGGDVVYTLALPPGGEDDFSDDTDPPWQQVLAAIEAATDVQAGFVSLDCIPEVSEHPLGDSPLVGLVSRTLSSLG